MNRIKLLTAILFFSALKLSVAQLDMNKSKLEIEPLGENVYLFIQQTNVANPSSVVYNAPGGVAVLIDPGFIQMQQAIKDSIKTKTGSEIKHVMATHFHIDHAQAIEKYYNNTNILLSAHQYEKAADMNFSNMLSANELTLKLGFEELEVHTLPNAAGHTDADAVFYFKKANVLVVGDYLFQDMFPVIDVKGGGSIKKYFENIDSIMNLANEDTKIVPGHTSLNGDSMRYLSLSQFQKHNKTLLESIQFIEAAKKSGSSLDQITAQGLPEKFAYMTAGKKYVSEEKWITNVYNNY